MRFLFFIQNTSEYDILSFTLVFFFNLSYITVFVRKSFLYIFFFVELYAVGYIVYSQEIISEELWPYMCFYGGF